jgi:hypothetical protein
MLAEPTIFPDVAVMLEVPAVNAVATPLEFMFATPAVEELHVTDAEMSLLLPSLYTPVAKKDVVVPTSATGPDGAIVIAVSEGCGGGGVVTVLEVLLLPPQPNITMAATNVSTRDTGETRANRIVSTPSFQL